MRDLTILSVQDIGDDVLHVTATYVDDDGHEQPLEAYGWVSATTNHYDANAYAEYDADAAADPDSGVAEGLQLKPDAKPSPMTPAEVGAYARRLLLEQHPALAADAPAEPTPIAFE